MAFFITGPAPAPLAFRAWRALPPCLVLKALEAIGKEQT
jgi:hypothetical protein